MRIYFVQRCRQNMNTRRVGYSTQNLHRKLRYAFTYVLSLLSDFYNTHTITQFLQQRKADNLAGC
jgi:hypothetical protein